MTSLHLVFNGRLLIFFGGFPSFAASLVCTFSCSQPVSCNNPNSNFELVNVGVLSYETRQMNRYTISGL